MAMDLYICINADMITLTDKPEDDKQGRGWRKAVISRFNVLRLLHLGTEKKI